MDLIEADGLAPYTYSEELPYDDLLDQHRAGVQHRTQERPALVVAALPRADSPSADRYVAEREGPSAWSTEGDGADRGGQWAAPRPGEASPEARQRQASEHPVQACRMLPQFNPATARARDLCATELGRLADRSVAPPPLGEFQASLLRSTG